MKSGAPIFTNGNLGVSIYEEDPSLPYDIYYGTNLFSPVQRSLASHGIVGQTNYVFANSFGGSLTFSLSPPVPLTWMETAYLMDALR